jgi:hypothetical protein
MSTVYLKDVARMIRSKNAGPFEITIDIIFKNNEDLHKVWDNGIIDKKKIFEIYHIEPEKISTLEIFEAANAIKITFPRPRAQGSVGEVDMHAAQQHVPIMFIDVGSIMGG